MDGFKGEKGHVCAEGEKLKKTFAKQKEIDYNSTQNRWENGDAGKKGVKMGERGNGEIRFRERKRWLFLGLPFTFTVYDVGEDMITVSEGFLNKKENDCYMYKVQDVELLESLPERIFGLGTVRCHTGDTTSPVLLISHVKNARAVKNFILEASEKARIRRRTMNMLDIGADEAQAEEGGEL